MNIDAPILRIWWTACRGKPTEPELYYVGYFADRMGPRALAVCTSFEAARAALRLLEDK